MASALNTNSIAGLIGKAPDERSGRIVSSLCAVYPESISAKQLMIRSGFPFHCEPIQSFISLCISFSQVNQALSRAGWQAERSGGTPEDHYRLEPIRAGPLIS
jgi:hypothetical protein